MHKQGSPFPYLSFLLFCVLSNYSMLMHAILPSNRKCILFYFLISKREETVLKRNTKTMTQNIQKRMHPPSQLGQKQLSKAEKQKNHPHRDPTHSMKPTKVEGPSCMNNFLSDQRK